MPRRVPVTLILLAGVVGTGCSGPAWSVAPGPARAPPRAPPLATGHLELRVVYPPPEDRGLRARAGEQLMVVADSTYRIQSHDSAFVFGSAGRGDARVTVNGVQVPVYPTGGWIAWLPLPQDTLARFAIVATAEGRTARLTLVAPIAQRFEPPTAGIWIDTTSLVHTGDRWVRSQEGLRLVVRAAVGASVRALMADGSSLPFAPESTPPATPWDVAARGSTTLAGDGPLPPARYVAWHVGPLGPDPGYVLAPDSAPPPDDSTWVWIEAVRGVDTLRVRWPLRVAVIGDGGPPPLVVVNDDTAQTGLTDSVLAGRPTPWGTYNWFFPYGTVAAVSGRWNNQVRLQLSGASVAWVDAGDVQPLPPGSLAPRGVARSMRLVPNEHSVTLRIPLPGRIPFRVDETEREIRLTLYGVAADMDWIRYGGPDPFVKLIAYAQPAEDVTLVTVTLADAVWGYRTTWSGNTLLLEIRRPPEIDPKHPLRGLRIVLDPGHPPAGATGPTGLREPEVAFAVALRAKALLETRGAQVVFTRLANQSLGIVQRAQFAERAGGDLLVSIHANALPDGVNPFVNNGTSVFYFHPRSAPLARALDRALVHQLGFRNLGMGRGDLHLVRPTWMPAALTEGLFIMVPDQEAVLASEEGQARYAQGIVDGIELFLWQRAADRR